MGKNQKPSQSPATAPGAGLPPEGQINLDLPPASDLPEVPEAKEPESEILDPTLVLAATQAEASPCAKYRVANLFQGFRKQDLHEGDVVEADEDEAAPYLGKDGVLIRIEDEA